MLFDLLQQEGHSLIKGSVAIGRTSSRSERSRAKGLACHRPGMSTEVRWPCKYVMGTRTERAD